jgi:SAM-dependent methyltransferase
MGPTPKPNGDQAGCNPALLRAVAPSARRILDVGCGKGEPGATRKAQDPARQVFGVEGDPAPAAQASARLDQVFPPDLDLPLPPARPFLTLPFSDRIHVKP